MSEVYTNADLTMAASNSKSDAGSFLGFENNEGNAIFPQGSQTFCFAPNTIGLNKRGCVLQERVLSPRILYLTHYLTYFEYLSVMYCENGSASSSTETRIKVVLDPDEQWTYYY